VVTGRRSSALVAAVVLLVGGCSSDDPEELSLEDSSEAAAPEEGDEAEASDGEPAEDAADAEQESPGDAEEQLYPPLPPLEPNPDSDVPVEDQELGLRLHAETYEATQSALAHADLDEGELSEHLAGELLGQMTDSLSARAAAGHVSRAPDTSIDWVEVVFAEGGPIIVQECRLVGPETGTYSRDGERVDEGRDEVVPVVFETRYALVELDSGDVDYRAVEATSGTDEQLCDV
jgi:hypothetical protein